MAMSRRTLFSVHVNKIPLNYDEEEILGKFNEVGNVRNHHFNTENIPHFTYAFMRYATKDECLDAIEVFNETEYNGSILKVSMANEQPRKFRERSSSRGPSNRRNSSPVTRPVSRGAENGTKSNLHNERVRNLRTVLLEQGFVEDMPILIDELKQVPYVLPPKITCPPEPISLDVGLIDDLVRKKMATEARSRERDKSNISPSYSYKQKPAYQRRNNFSPLIRPISPAQTTVPFNKIEEPLEALHLTENGGSITQGNKMSAFCSDADCFESIAFGFGPQESSTIGDNNCADFYIQSQKCKTLDGGKGICESRNHLVTDRKHKCGNNQSLAVSNSSFSDSGDSYSTQDRSPYKSEQREAANENYALIGREQSGAIPKRRGVGRGRGALLFRDLS